MRKIFIRYLLFLKIQVLEIINDLNEQVFQYASNSNAARQLLKKCKTRFISVFIESFFRFIADEINRLTSSNFQCYLMGDRIAKRELILAGRKT